MESNNKKFQIKRPNFKTQNRKKPKQFPISINNNINKNNKKTNNK